MSLYLDGFRYYEANAQLPSSAELTASLEANAPPHTQEKEKKQESLRPNLKTFTRYEKVETTGALVARTVTKLAPTLSKKRIRFKIHDQKFICPQCKDTVGFTSTEKLANHLKKHQLLA